MSLPSIAIFCKDNEAIYECFVNIGWVYDEQNIPNLLRDILYRGDIPLDYDYITMYDFSIDEKEVANILKIYYDIDYYDVIYKQTQIKGEQNDNKV